MFILRICKQTRPYYNTLATKQIFKNRPKRKSLKAFTFLKKCRPNRKIQIIIFINLKTNFKPTSHAWTPSFFKLVINVYSYY